MMVLFRPVMRYETPWARVWLWSCAMVGKYHDRSIFISSQTVWYDCAVREDSWVEIAFSMWWSLGRRVVVSRMIVRTAWRVFVRIACSWGKGRDGKILTSKVWTSTSHCASKGATISSWILAECCGFNPKSEKSPLFCSCCICPTIGQGHQSGDQKGMVAAGVLSWRRRTCIASPGFSLAKRMILHKGF